MDVLPAWAEALFREKFGVAGVTRVEVLKDTAFHKIVVGYTPTHAILAEKGLLGRNAYLLPSAVVNPARAAAPAAAAPLRVTERPAPARPATRRSTKKASERPKPRRAPPGSKEPKEAPEAREAPEPPKPKANRGKVAPRRKPPAKAPAEAEPAEPALESPSSRAAEAPPAPAMHAPPKGRAIDLVDGIGPSYTVALREHGLRTAEELLAADAAMVAAKVDVPVEVAERWQALARLQQVDVIGPQSSELLVRAGFRDLESLAQETPESLAKRLGDDDGGVGGRVQNLTITPELCAGWIQGAREALERSAGKA